MKLSPGVRKRKRVVQRNGLKLIGGKPDIIWALYEDLSSRIRERGKGPAGAFRYLNYCLMSNATNKAVK